MDLGPASPWLFLAQVASIISSWRQSIEARLIRLAEIVFAAEIGNVTDYQVAIASRPGPRLVHIAKKEARAVSQRGAKA